MRKFRIVGDISSNPFHSSRIIIDATNKAAKKLGLYDEKGLTVCYDTLCNSHGYHVDAFWSAYELPFPAPVLNNAGGKPIIGLSRDSAWLVVSAGYPAEKVNFCTLGVDKEIWKPVKKNKYLDKFVFLSMTESNVRCGLDDVIHSFGKVFAGRKDVILYIKDRQPTPKFVEWVKKASEYYDVEVIHDERHIENHEIEREIFACADVHVYLNHCGAFNMTVTQGMACGIPTITMAYGGPADYASWFNAKLVDYNIVPVTDRLLLELAERGMKNHFFSSQQYTIQPFWAQPDEESLQSALIEIKEGRNAEEERARLKYFGPITASWLSWEKTAINMSFLLSEFCKE